MGLDRDKLLEALRASFAAEVEEALPRLEGDLLALDRGGDAPDTRLERIHAVFRTIHGLKGAARAASYPDAEQLCHQLEERFGKARESGEVDEGLVDDALTALDTLRGQAASEPKPPPHSEHRAPVPPRPDAPAHAPANGSPNAPSAPGEQSAPGPAAAAEARLERVRPELLDRALGLSHELGVAHGRLADRLAGLGNAIADVRELEGQTLVEDRVDLERRLGMLERRLRRLQFDLRQDRRLFDQLQDALEGELGRSRRVPFGVACQGLERVVRDVASARGKQARAELLSQDLEIDREVAERLQGALLQLVRNAVDHGLETPEARVAAGKRPEGTIRIDAELQGAEVRVTVGDDGRGLDEAALREAARRRGLELSSLAGASEVWRLALRPGISTAREVSDVSGRGVGLDVVRDRVEAMHGQLRVWSGAGEGTQFTLMLPVSLAARRALVVIAGGRELGLLTSNVRRVHRADPRRVGNAGGRTVLLRTGEDPLPMGDLAAALGLSASGAEGRVRILELRTDEGDSAVRVDEVVGEEEVLVKSLGPQVRKLRSYTGLGVRAGGKLLPLISADRLVRAAREANGAMTLLAAMEAEDDVRGERKRVRVVVADDSLTTRTLERSILEAAGYDVQVASDGAEAWRLLQEQGADVLVSDVEMPVMDGFRLTQTVRGSRRFAELPVVLVTALASDEDRRRGMEVGADAYLVKSAFDQTLLLKTLSDLLGRRT